MTYYKSYKKLSSVDEILKEAENDINHFWVSKDRAEVIRDAAERAIHELINQSCTVLMSKAQSN
jgi:hypothetical protein